MDMWSQFTYLSIDLSIYLSIYLSIVRLFKFLIDVLKIFSNTAEIPQKLIKYKAKLNTYYTIQSKMRCSGSPCEPLGNDTRSPETAPVSL